MVNIQYTILEKYGIDIAQDNILKLYGIEQEDISNQELEKKLQEKRKKWTTNVVNGTNEKFIEKARVRLEKADTYELILRDPKLRKQIFLFYKNPSGGSAAGSNDFAKEYFELVATTKKIRKADVDFFFQCYKSERKNKKVILEMLKKEMKVKGLGKEESYAEEDEKEVEGKTKNESSPLISNLFQEATIVKISRVMDLFEQAAKSQELSRQYLTLHNGLYEFLGMKAIANIQQFSKLIDEESGKVQKKVQENGGDYRILQDLYNELAEISKYKDVVDNMIEFKLLLKYPKLSPYMYVFVEMKPKTVKEMVIIAKREYGFRDEADFILNYFNPIHDNFGISDSAIGSILKKAEKKAAQNKILSGIDQLVRKNKSTLPAEAAIVYYLLYWPIYAFYFVIEVVKFIFKKMHLFAIPMFVILFLLLCMILPQHGMEELSTIRYIFNKEQWSGFLYDVLGGCGDSTVIFVLSTLAMLFKYIAAYIFPAVCGAVFISNFADLFNKKFDWVGIERTFQQIFRTLKEKTEEQYRVYKKAYIRSKMLKIIINFVCLALLIGLVIFVPMAFNTYSQTTGYFQ